MPRLPGWVLGCSVVLALLAHAVLLAPNLEPLDPLSGAVLARAHAHVAVLFALAGRVVLSFLPPGEVGSHAWRDLPVTAATSLLVGFVVAWLMPDAGAQPLYWIVPLLFLCLARWLTLPGAMVPRHAPQQAPLGRLDSLAAVAGVGWAIYTLLVDSIALHWLALLVVGFHALRIARRHRAGGYALVALGAALFQPPGALHAGRFSGLVQAVSLGFGASFLVPWLRRNDRRAGVLAALGFGSSFLDGFTALALVGPLVMIGASHARQRRFATIALIACALPFLLVSEPEPGRARLLWLPEILSGALSFPEWGLAWPLLAAALVLGALTFPWRAVEWTPGTIEEPRQEARAIGALVVLAAGAVALPSAPWAEVDVLLIFFLPCALLAGLLLLPPERVPANS